MRKIDLNNFQVASSETARDVNCRIMLNLVRKHQPVSRADLMRYSGLQRSTVSVITDQLLLERWLREGEVGQLPRGRKPTYLHLNEDRAGIFGINLQPGTTDLALANLGGRFIRHESMLTPASPEVFVEKVGGKVREWMAQYPTMLYEDIGLSLPGRVDLQSQQFVFAPNLGWKSTDLKTQLENATGLKVEMENAANACALSEFWFGDHHDHVRNLIVVTVSEGIGVGMILNGQIVRGSTGLAGEFGHVPLNEQGPTCRCGNQGCWEVYASNTAGLRYYQEFAREANGSKSKPAAPNSIEELLRLADAGDTRAIQALEKMAQYLGQGAAMLISGLSPDVIVFVGEVTRAWDRIEPILSRVISQRVSTHPAIKIAACDPGPQPRLRGIIALVLQKHFGAPHVA